MGSMLPYIAYMDPMGMILSNTLPNSKHDLDCIPPRGWQLQHGTSPKKTGPLRIRSLILKQQKWRVLRNKMGETTNQTRDKCRKNRGNQLNEGPYHQTCRGKEGETNWWWVYSVVLTNLLTFWWGYINKTSCKKIRDGSSGESCQTRAFRKTNQIHLAKLVNRRSWGLFPEVYPLVMTNSLLWNPWPWTYIISWFTHQ